MSPAPAPDENSASAEAAPEATTLRRRLVDYLVREGAIRSPQLEAAFADIPREFFLPPEIPLSRVYSDDAIVVKWDENGQPSSSSSQPFLMADMLETLGLAPGMRVLEIGAGVGYNAAIMAHVLGDGALLTSVDLDPVMADTARRNLHTLAQQLGSSFERVTVIAGDGSLGYAPHAPYDRIIVTVQQWEIAPEWVNQLQVGGLLLMPLTLSTQFWGSMIPAFRKEADGTLQAVAASYGSFMPMRGEMAHPPGATTTERGRLIRLPLGPAQVLPGWEPPTGIAPEAAQPRLFLPETQLPPNLAAFLEQPQLPQIIACEVLPLEFGAVPTSGPEATPAQRAAAQAFHGFNLALAASGCQLFSLGLALPTTGEEQGQAPEGQESTANNKEGWQLQVRGLGLAAPVGAGFDLAFITSSDPAASWQGRVVQGWRLMAAGQSALDANLPNQALLHISEVWQAWQRMGRPTPARYRPLAFRADQLPKNIPGYAIPRRYYNLLLPFDPPAVDENIES